MNVEFMLNNSKNMPLMIYCMLLVWYMRIKRRVFKGIEYFICFWILH